MLFKYRRVTHLRFCFSIFFFVSTHKNNSTVPHTGLCSSRSSLAIISINSACRGSIHLSLVGCRTNASTITDFPMVLLRIVISIAIVHMMLLLRLWIRRESFPITTRSTLKHGISSIMTMKLLVLVRIVTGRVVVLMILCTTTFSSLVVWPGPLVGRIVGRVVLVLSVPIRMMIHHHVMLMMMITTVVVIALMILLMVRLVAVVYMIKVPLIPIIPIVSIVLIWHPGILVLIIKLLHHHMFASGVVAAIEGVTACGGGRGVVTPIVNLWFACFDFAALPENVQDTSFPRDIVKERVCYFL